MLRLLATVAVVGLTAGCCPDDFEEEFQLDTDADLNAVVGLVDGLMIATADGQLIRTSKRGWLRSGVVEISVDVPLNALEAHDDRIWAVGDEGMFLQKIGDAEWEIVDLGTDARLLDVTMFTVQSWSLEEWLVVVGDGVLRAQDLESGMWYTPSEPAGGWGELRAVFAGSRIFAVGKDGAAWSCLAPTGAWVAEDIGLGKVDINGGGKMDPTYTRSWVIGDAGSLAYHDGSSWTVVATSVRDDLLEFSSGFTLSRDGRLFIVDDDGGLRRVDKTAGLNRGLFSEQEGNVGEDVIVVGEDGRGWTYRKAICPPF